MSDAPVPLRRRLRARALRGVVRAGGLLPRGLVEAGLLVGTRAAARGQRGRLARENLARALGSDLDAVAREAVLRDATRFAARQLAEWTRLARGAPPEGPGRARGDWIDELVALDATVDRLDAVLAEGRGAIVVTAHLGNWELLCARLRRRGLGGAVVGRERRRDPSHAWLTEMRRAYGVRTVPQDAPPREALGVLREGGVLGLLCDLRVKRLHGVDVPFFGAPARTMTAPAAFARAHRAPLVPVRCVAADRGRGAYTLSVDAPLHLDRSRERDAAARDLLERMNAVYERWIREAPEQWAWHQRRW